MASIRSVQSQRDSGVCRKEGHSKVCGWWSIDVELDLLQVFLWALSLPVVVVEATVPATQLLDIVVMGPPVHLVTRWGCEEVRVGV